jgi:hypothetical protein
MRFRKTVILVIGLIGMAAAGIHPAHAFTPTPVPRVGLEKPSSGDPLQGMVAVAGEVKGTSIVRITLAFVYPGQEGQPRFVIADIDPEQADPFQVEWDTTTVTDGVYDLLLEVRYENGEMLRDRVSNVRVRNYTTIETHTPSPTETPASTVRITATRPEPTQQPTPTSLPPNPVSVGRHDIIRSLGVGLMVTLGVFALLGVYVGVRKIFR